MIKNYLLIAFRNIIKHKGYSFINLFGLAVGIALSVMIMLYIQDELSYDRYHKHADRIYRLAQIIEPAENSSSIPFPARHMLLNEFPAMITFLIAFLSMGYQTVKAALLDPVKSLKYE